MRSEHLIFKIDEFKETLFAIPLSCENQFTILQVMPYSAISYFDFNFTDEFSKKIIPFGAFIFKEQIIPLIEVEKYLKIKSYSTPKTKSFTSSVIIIEFSKNNIFALLVEQITKITTLEEKNDDLKNKILSDNLMENSFIHNCFSDDEQKFIELKISN